MSFAPYGQNKRKQGLSLTGLHFFFLPDVSILKLMKTRVCVVNESLLD